MKEITREILESVVPERIFWRGEDLYDEGAVQDVDVSEKQISAKVLGTRLYSVEAKIREDTFMFSCSCPYEGFCKHSIALGLWMVEHKRILSKMRRKLSQYIINIPKKNMPDGFNDSIYYLSQENVNEYYNPITGFKLDKQLRQKTKTGFY